jgi:hypothetical protein
VEVKDEEDGVSERYLPRHDQMRMDREKEPRFAPMGSFEYRFAQKYREVDDMEKQQIERVKKEMDEMRVKLESEMEGAMYEYQAEQIRAGNLKTELILKHNLYCITDCSILRNYFICCRGEIFIAS